MELYTGLGMLLAIGDIYSTKNNRIKCSEICKLAAITLMKYTLVEFMEFKFNANGEPLQQIPEETVNGKLIFLYKLAKEKLLRNNDEKLIELNILLQSLTKEEEEDLMDVLIVSITKPGDILYNL